MKNWATPLVLVLGGFVLGTIAVFWYYDNLHFDNKLPSVQLFNTLLTCVLAYFVNKVWQASASTKAKQRELLLENCKEVQECIKKTYEAFRSAEPRKRFTAELARSIQDSERELSVAISTLESMLNHCRIDCQNLSRLRKSRLDLKKALTNDPFPKGPYTSEKSAVIVVHFNALRTIAGKLLFEINEAV